MRLVPIWSRSLILRIVALQLVTLAIAILAILLSIRVLLNDVFAAFEHQALRDHAVAISRAVTVTPSGLSVNLPGPLAILYAQDSGGFQYRVINALGQVIASSRHGGAITPEPLHLAAEPSYFQHASGGSGYFGGSFPGRVGNRAYWVEIVQNLAHPDVYADDVVRVFLARIVWFIPPIALAMLTVNILIVQRALRPVVIASRHAEAIHPRRTDVRLPERGLPIEIMPLVKAVNRALDRLADGFRQQREFTADVAHELRTPLAVLRLRADRVADPMLSEAFRIDIDAMSHLTDQLLALAELETFALPVEARADLRQVAVDVISLLAPAALAAGLEIELVSGETPVWVHGHAENLFRALRNLVENALAHSPPGATVTIKVEANGELSVSDHGPGVAEADISRIFQRGWRRDRQTPGHGLGLSIVQRIAQAHGATVTFEETNGGGATFKFRLEVGSVAPGGSSKYATIWGNS